MFKEIKQKIGLEVSEIIGLLSLTSVVYATLLQLVFLYQLNAEWYLPFLSTQQILLSSFLIIAIFIIGGVLGFIIFSVWQILNDKIPLQVQAGILFLTMILTIVTYILAIPELLLFTLSVFCTYIMADQFKNFRENKHGLAVYNKVFAIVLASIMVFCPIDASREKASKIFDDPSRYLSRVDIKSKESNWYLVETNSTQALLIQEKSNKFKLVKVEDIQEVMSPNKISILDTFIQNTKAIFK